MKLLPVLILFWCVLWSFSGGSGDANDNELRFSKKGAKIFSRNYDEILMLTKIRWGKFLFGKTTLRGYDCLCKEKRGEEIWGCEY
jgi:hypothetical protein